MFNAKKTDKVDRFFNKLRRRLSSYPKKYPDIWEEGLKASIKNYPHRKKRSIASNIYAVGYVEAHLPYLRMLKNKSLLSRF
jgi:hypothetical protein